MAQAPNKGLTFTVDGKKCVFGTLDNGDANVIVLAIEKSTGANDYSWEAQIDIDYLRLRYKSDIDAAMVEVLKQTNEVLAQLFGKVESPVTDVEKFQAYIMNNLVYDSAANKIVGR